MAFNSNMRSSRRKLKSEINVVPYIDVMLVLLIIFMAVPPTQNPSEIKLPSAERSTQPPDDYIQIAVKQNAQLQIGVTGKQARALEDVSSRSALIERLRAIHAEHPDYPVMISGDRESKYDDVIQMISEAKKMGINRVGLATK
ncbi:biopolymer transporter ExbD [Massilia sp. WF1]|uniref:biopolymer transporter ExbD n=1 Tax=unclassified Massilia TaxID=2609279 RepID=UPI0006493211|nr:MULTISPECIES: biopolymer transporter ExbD [unclassified Massilia]ALK96453.1 biopolymer transporter ExbD [Massilia sp. WG5]KLU37794.1 biopolymer transporter ExbD [Massilia sp. WF1]